MRKKVLLTGSNGFLGNIISCSIFPSFDIFTLGRSKCFINCDLSNSVPLLPLVEIIIHVAGKAHTTPKNLDEKQTFFDVNSKGTKNLLLGLENSKSLPKTFVFVSSVAVYGIETGVNISEDAPLLAQDPYGLSKIEAEQLIINWCFKNNVVYTILRLPLLVGKNPPGNLRAMLNAIKNGYYFNIGSGSSKKSMVLAEDVANFIPVIAPIGGIYNLTDGVHPSFDILSSVIARKKTKNLPLIIAIIVGKIGDLLGKRAPLNSMKIKKITSDLTFDDSKARAMGWNPQSVLEYLNINDL
jgi:nucleoside-diphosphate-sugar epimerase